MTIQAQAQEFLKDRQKVNNVLLIIKTLQNNTNKSECLKALEMIFTTVLKRKEFIVHDSLRAKSLEEWKIENEYVSWLKTSYDSAIAAVSKVLYETDEKLSVQALETLMNFLKHEGKYPKTDNLKDHAISLNSLVKLPVLSLLSETERNSVLLKQFQNYLSYPDVLALIWQKLWEQVSERKYYPDIFMNNVLDLLDNLGASLTEYKNANFEPREMFFQHDKFVFNYKLVQGYLNKIWTTLLKQTYNITIHKRFLIVLLERLFNHFSNPLFLTDFLISSSNFGGATSLLALQGVLLLVQKHNMEYPNIYGKLYAMFEPKILYEKYKARLFYLGDIFLSSSHLQEQLVAAFAKRVARLCLTARSEDIKLMIMFIGNLILRHPGLRKLIHHPSGEEVQNDPYLMDEVDPIKSHASESSLWELELLKNHIQPSISSAARFIDQNLPTVEWDLSLCLDDTIEEVFEREIKIKQKDIPLNFIRPRSITTMSEDKLFKLWQLT